MSAENAHNSKTWTVQEREKGLRLDHFLAKQVPLSLAELRRHIARGQVLVNGKPASKGWLLRLGQTVQYQRGQEKIADILVTIPACSESRVLFQNDKIIVVNKPAGLPANARSSEPEDCLLQRLGKLFPELLAVGDDPRDGALLHRLDVGTSGAIALARSDAHYLDLRARFHQGLVDKYYLALVLDPTQLLPEHGVIDWPMAHAGRSGRMLVMKKGTERHRGKILSARTAFHVLERGAKLSLVMLLIRQGRMHQIRAHLAALGFPIYGDAVYGQLAEDFSHQALHAWMIDLRFAHGQKSIVIQAPFAEDFVELCQQVHLDCDCETQRDAEKMNLLKLYNTS